MMCMNIVTLGTYVTYVRFTRFAEKKKEKERKLTVGCPDRFVYVSRRESYDAARRFL